MAERLIVAVWRTNRVFPLVIGALLLLNILAYLGISYFFAPRIAELERRYIAAQGDARQAIQRREQLATPQQRFRTNTEDLQAFWKAIPPREQFSELIREIFSISGEAGLTIERISYEPKMEENLLRYALSFSVAGNYGQIKKFIHYLEQSPRIIAIEELALSGKDASEGEAVSLRVRLSTYFKLGS
jgi:type IV pilus assembly protein PilO